MEANEWQPILNVKFTDEAEVDDGGLSREFFDLLYSVSLCTSLLPATKMHSKHKSMSFSEALLL